MSPPIAPRLDKAPTILDVAAVAGVSKSTVSNVVRGAAEVSAATRARVLDAIEGLGYKPNALARHFVNQRTNILGVLAGDMDDPYHARLAQAVAREASRVGFATMLGSVDDGIEVLMAHRVAGVVACATRSSKLDEALRREGIPTVILGASRPAGDSVGPTDRPGGRMATEHLLGLGHRRIAYVRTPLVERSADRARHAGYSLALRQAELEPLPVHGWDPGSSTFKVGRRELPVAEALSGPRAPTAAFVSNDVGAIAFIDACEGLGLGVPKTISVVGFDDIAIAGLRRISLSTVAQSLEFQAERAVALLLERIENPRLDARHESVSVEFRARASSAPPP